MFSALLVSLSLLPLGSAIVGNIIRSRAPDWYTATMISEAWRTPVDIVEQLGAERRIHFQDVDGYDLPVAEYATQVQAGPTRHLVRINELLKAKKTPAQNPLDERDPNRLADEYLPFERYSARHNSQSRAQQLSVETFVESAARGGAKTVRVNGETLVDVRATDRYLNGRWSGTPYKGERELQQLQKELAAAKRSADYDAALAAKKKADAIADTEKKAAAAQGANDE